MLSSAAPLSNRHELLRLAHGIDPDRAPGLERELGTETEARALAVLLGTAFPPLTPVHGWQLAALELMEVEGTRGAHDRKLTLGRLLTGFDLDDVEAALRNLRRAVWAEKARIALRELLPRALGGADVDVTARELAELGDAALEAALLEADAAVARRYGPPLRADGVRSSFVVFGMGKLGGLELNAGSDIDVVFLYDTDDGGSELTLHEHWSRVARRLVATLEAPSADGFVWRVDLRLRPEGSQGPMANSAAAAERYYETWGRLWERAALLRSRPCAGDLQLGEQIAREVFLPFVYRRDVDPNIATALAEQLERARAELSAAPERDLKLGPGGIREAEFFIQALQLVWGGREPSLRVQGSLSALARLETRGLVTAREARDIARAYALLRRLEHRVQWMTGIQTHLLPEGDGLGKLARSLGFADERPLLLELAGLRERVAQLFAALAPSAPRRLGRHQRLVTPLIEQDTEAAAAAVEASFGTAQVLDHLLALARRPDGLLGARTLERHPDLIGEVLDALAGASDIQQAARYLRALFARFYDPAPYVTALAEHHHAVQRLITVLGASVLVGDAILSRPDLADFLLFESGTAIDPRQEVGSELDRREPRAAQAGHTPALLDARDAFISGLRRAKRRSIVQVAVADLAGIIETREATRLLSDLADEALERTLRFELGDTRGLAVIAMGKLGGRDIGYGSDLDVLFIYDPTTAPNSDDPGPYFIRRAQRIIRLLSEPHPDGPGYELDTRLRPSGSHGLLVTSLASFATYHGVHLDQARRSSRPAVLSSGAAWERQALLRARACAGDPSLGRQVIAVAAEAAYERGAPPVEEVHRLRVRMQKELARERPGYYDLKTGRGGLLDVEFATQWLQMNHGADPQVRTTDTLDALDALMAGNYLARRDYDALRDGYVFLRRLEQRMHVLHGQSSTLIDVRRSGLTQLARRMAIQDSARLSAKATLIDSYQNVTAEIRAAYARVLGVSPDA